MKINTKRGGWVGFSESWEIKWHSWTNTDLFRHHPSIVWRKKYWNYRSCRSKNDLSTRTWPRILRHSFRLQGISIVSSWHIDLSLRTNTRVPDFKRKNYLFFLIYSFSFVSKLFFYWDAFLFRTQLSPLLTNYWLENGGREFWQRSCQ